MPEHTELENRVLYDVCSRLALDHMSCVSMGEGGNCSVNLFLLIGEVKVPQVHTLVIK